MVSPPLEEICGDTPEPRVVPAQLGDVAEGTSSSSSSSSSSMSGVAGAGGGGDNVDDLVDRVRGLDSPPPAASGRCIRCEDCMVRDVCYS